MFFANISSNQFLNHLENVRVSQKKILFQTTLIWAYLFSEAEKKNRILVIILKLFLKPYDERSLISWLGNLNERPESEKDFFDDGVHELSEKIRFTDTEIRK